MEFFKDLLGFFGSRKKYWLLPIVLVLLGFGVLIGTHERLGYRTVHLHPVLRSHDARPCPHSAGGPRR